MKTLSVKLTMSEEKMDYIKGALETQYMVKEATLTKTKDQHIRKVFPNKTITIVRVKLLLYESCKDSHLIELGNLIHHYGWTQNDLKSDHI